jgi:DNA-binding ferritin-like protein (Dps family)
MAAKWIELVTGSLEDKKRYKQYKSRERALPESYRTAIEAIDRYLMYAGGVAKSEVLLSMMSDLADLFEQSAASGTSVREIVGDDPLEFVETFLRNYSDGQWINKERARLTEAIDRAEAEGNGS